MGEDVRGEGVGEDVRGGSAKIGRTRACIEACQRIPCRQGP